MIPIDLVIPDAGPLISLAHAGRLDLIELFKRPVAVLDVVRLECLRKPDSPDYWVIREWFDTRANAIRIIDTPILAIYEKALGDERSGRNRRATRGLGDAAFGWLLPNLDTIVPRGTVPLVLTEDRNLSFTLGGQQAAHILSTRAWLLGLENAGVIESAGDVIARIGRHGRVPSPMQVDKPFVLDELASDWLSATVGGADTSPDRG